MDNQSNRQKRCANCELSSIAANHRTKNMKLRIKMKTFPGQTEENAFVRATPIIKAMQLRVATVDSIAN